MTPDKAFQAARRFVQEILDQEGVSGDKIRWHPDTGTPEAGMSLHFSFGRYEDQFKTHSLNLRDAERIAAGDRTYMAALEKGLRELARS
jgi:hypothetical protein